MDASEVIQSLKGLGVNAVAHDENPSASLNSVVFGRFEEIAEEAFNLGDDTIVYVSQVVDQSSIPGIPESKRYKGRFAFVTK